MIKFVFLSFTALLLLSLADESFAESRRHNKYHSHDKHKHSHDKHEHSHDEHEHSHEDDCDGDCKHNHGKRDRH